MENKYYQLCLGPTYSSLMGRAQSLVRLFYQHLQLALRFRSCVVHLLLEKQVSLAVFATFGQLLCKNSHHYSAANVVPPSAYLAVYLHLSDCVSAAGTVLALFQPSSDAFGVELVPAEELGCGCTFKTNGAWVICEA